MHLGNMNFVAAKLLQSTNTWHMRIDFEDNSRLGRGAEKIPHCVIRPARGERQIKIAALVERCSSDNDEPGRRIDPNGAIRISVLSGCIKNVAMVALSGTFNRAHEPGKANNIWRTQQLPSARSRGGYD